MNQNWRCIFPKKLLLRAYSTLKHSLSTTVLVAFHPRFQIKVPQMTIHSDLLQLKQLNSMEILIYFIFKTIKCDRSTWPARRKVDRSTRKSVRTLSVDRPLFWLFRALPVEKFTVIRVSFLTLRLERQFYDNSYLPYSSPKRFFALVLLRFNSKSKYSRLSSTRRD